MGVTARRVDDIDAAGNVPGAFEYYAEGDRAVAGMVYICPCGCGSHGDLPFRPATPAHPSWQWDGNREAPTLDPSVHDIYRKDGQIKTHWHGWLRKGVWTSV